MNNIHHFYASYPDHNDGRRSPLAEYAATKPRSTRRPSHPSSDRWFHWLLGAVCFGYVLFLASMTASLAGYTSPLRVVEILTRPAIAHSLWLTLWASTVATVAAMLVAIPIGYLMGRARFFGQGVVDNILDIPNVFPPMVLGLALLTLFQYPPLRQLSPSIVYQVPAILLVYFVVAISFSLPVLRTTFKELDPRLENVALTLGCSRFGAFLKVAIPEARYGLFSAAITAWSRCFGCFGPLLVFAGATRNKTEVLATSVYLELGGGEIDGAVAASLFMIAVAGLVLSVSRWLTRHYQHRRSEG
ncbi:ABC transporter permease [Blastopirellula sp. JC732]|uniref:ABC transporter permease n=1 Tax=Blastopirellula sediminis TaxID=2894196 RepID=A0A9X1MNP7_9BACT|nr:ABC transporter permease [Blastopirellula sediminis]MCC9608404.1 ABC transporter permease [Blastopirellula sediminis]MCC9628819.1 ABC transporter permease [Blastopirellula sediminis]